MYLLKSLIALPLAATVLCSGSSALARATMATSGAALSPADAGCFRNSDGAVTNNCTATKRFCVSGHTDGGVFGGANAYPRVNAWRLDSGQDITCRAESHSKDVWGYVQYSTWRDMSIVGAEDIDLGTLWVPNDGSLFVCCDIGPGGLVWFNSFRY